MREARMKKGRMKKGRMEKGGRRKKDKVKSEEMVEMIDIFATENIMQTTGKRVLVHCLVPSMRAW